MLDVVNVHKVKEFKEGVRVSRKVIDTEKILAHYHFYSHGAKVAPHKHDDSEDVYYVIEGEASVTVGEEKRILREGDILLIQKKTVHEVVNRSGKPLIILDILIPNPKYISGSRS